MSFSLILPYRPKLGKSHFVFLLPPDLFDFFFSHHPLASKFLLGISDYDRVYALSPAMATTNTKTTTTFTIISEIPLFVLPSWCQQILAQSLPYISPGIPIYYRYLSFLFGFLFLRLNPFLLFRHLFTAFLLFWVSAQPLVIVFVASCGSGVAAFVTLFIILRFYYCTFWN